MCTYSVLVYTAHKFFTTPCRVGGNTRMFDHLIDFDPDIEVHTNAAKPVEKNSVADTITAKANTVEWLDSLGVVDVDQTTTQLEVDAARKAFNAVVTASPAPDTHHQLAQIKTPEAVRKLVGMLTAYDWEFVQQAKEIRGYAVSKILEECESPTASVRLKALAMLGRITEVGLFTEKIEVKKTDLTEDEIDRKLKEKLAKFMDVSDADIIDIEPNGDDHQSTAHA